MIKDELIIINAFPKDETKIKMLERQLSYLKQLNLPILIISGCTVPEYISNQVDYVIVNTENEVLDKDWTYFVNEKGLYSFWDTAVLDKTEFHFYWPHVNSTITKNIKLSFNIAKFLGYKTVFYTEDDNIWKEGSFDYIKENIKALKSGQYMFGGVCGDQQPIDYEIIFTTFFFGNVNFICDNYILPHKKEEWYDINKIQTLRLYKTYERCVYELFKNKLNVFYNSYDFFEKLSKPNDLEWGIYDRRHSEKNLINTFFTVVRDKDNHKILILLNKSDYLKEGNKSYNISVYYNDIYYHNIDLPPYGFFHTQLDEDVKNIKLIIEGFGEKNIDCSIDKVKCNGFVIFK